MKLFGRMLDAPSALQLDCMRMLNLSRPRLAPGGVSVGKHIYFMTCCWRDAAGELPPLVLLSALPFNFLPSLLRLSFLTLNVSLSPHWPSA